MIDFKNTGLFSAFLWTTQVFAGPTPAKFFSYDCANRQNLKEASAFPFTFESKQYALVPASLTESAQNRCFEIQGVSQKSTLEVLASEWNGMTLLSLDSPVSEAEFELSGGTLVFGTKPVQVTGFSIHSNQSVQKTAQVMSDHSKRGTSTEMIELGLTPLDSGWIGSVVSQQGAFVGILADQSLHVVPGAQTWLQFIYPGSEAHGIRFEYPMVIYRDEIRQFVDSVLSSSVFIKPWKQRFFDPVSDYSVGVEKITTGGLTFASNCAPSTAPVQGGFDPVGIGGVDPIGIGGEGAYRLGCSIEVRPSTNVYLIHDESLDVKGQYSTVLQLLTQSEHLSSTYLYRKDERAKLLNRTVNFSLREFFAHLRREQGQMLFHAFRENEKLPASTQVSPAIATRALAYSEMARTVFERQLNGGDEISLGLLRETYFISLVILSENTGDVFKEQIDSLLDENLYGEAWQILQDPSQGGSLGLRARFLELRNDL